MHTVYISGALTSVPDPDEIKAFYEAIGRLCREVGLEAYIPHLNSDPLKHPELTPSEVFRLDKHHVSTSDLLIAYIGIPSLGTGMELAYAETLGIPVILLYEEGKSVSRLPRGIPTVLAEIQFRNHSNALAQLRTVLEEFTSTSVIRELHIEVKQPPYPDNQRFMIRDATGQVLFQGEAPFGDETHFLNALQGLKEKGIRPKRVFIEPFSNIADHIRSVWVESKVLLEYWK